MVDESFKITISDTQNAHELNRTLSCLFSTRAGSQPVDRDFGISWECLDELPEVAEALFYLEAVRKVEKYEPRVEISDITFERTQGAITPHIFFIGRGTENG